MKFALGLAAALLLAAPAVAVPALAAPAWAAEPGAAPLYTGTLTRETVDAFVAAIGTHEAQTVGFDVTLSPDVDTWTMRMKNGDGSTDLTLSGKDESGMNVDVYFAADPTEGRHLTGFYRVGSANMGGDSFALTMKPVAAPASTRPVALDTLR